MRIALADLRLDHLAVLYPGTKQYELAERITVAPIAMLAENGLEDLFPIRGRRRV